MCNKFEIGDVVCEAIRHRDDEICTGKIIGDDTKTPGVYLVEWDKNDWEKTARISKMQADDLMLESEADTKRVELEAEFAQLENKLKNKIHEAARLIKEASEIANQHNEELSSLYDITRPLMQAIDMAGWSASSLRC